MVNTRDTKGMDRFTAPRAWLPTPWATKMPSTMVYREKIHMETMDGMVNLKNLRTKFKGKTSSCCIYHKPSYYPKVKGRRQKN